MSATRFFLSLLVLPLFLVSGQAGPDCEKPASQGKKIQLKALQQNGPRWLRDGIGWLCQREFVEMMLAVLGGSNMGPGEGWFHEGQSRYGWKWLADRFEIDPEDGKITKEEWKGPDDLFARLDRNGDGAITEGDFDWTERSPFVRQAMEASRLFYKFDQDSNGRVSRREWDNLFNKLAKGKNYFTPEDLRELFKPPPRPPKNAKSRPAGMPAPEILFHGLLTGELGSPFEGPRIGERAPSFKLPTHDGKKKFSLGQFRGQKPVVLIFGSFT